ncbi:hypothetical protein JCM11491_005338 [Sporobolomyces phaffii]
MAPPKLAQCKVCHAKDAGKYRCPIDHVDYCSVACFKRHKEHDCRTRETYDPPPLPLLAPSRTHGRDDGNDDDDDDEVDARRPTKRLKDLHWPAEPSALAYDDPLARDDVKPLRPFEYEAVATSASVRAALSTRPALRACLERLARVEPRHARERALRVVLGLAADPTPNQYRPDPMRKFQTGVTTKDEDRLAHFQQQHSPNYRGRGTGALRGRGGRGGAGGGRGGRGGGGGARHDAGLVESTPEERKEMAEFAQEITSVLQQARNAKG